MTLSPEIKKDPEYRKAIAWFLGGVTVFFFAIFFIPMVAPYALLLGFIVGTMKYVKIRKKYLHPNP